MKHIWITVLVVFIAIQGSAQKAEVKDPKAKVILDKLSKKYNSLKTIRADFSLKMSNKKEKIEEKQDGTLYLMGQRYRLELMGAQTFSDGKTIWTLYKESQEANISSVDPADPSIFNQPSRLFTMYEKGFKYKFIREKKEAGKSLYEIELYPENLDMDLFPKGKKKDNLMKVKLIIDKALMQIHSIQYFGKDGVDYLISIRKFQSNPVIPETLFSFSKAQYPGYEINDLRD